MDVPGWIWAVSAVVILGMLTFDFYAHVRTPHLPSLKEAAFWSVFYIVLALLFGVGLWAVWGSAHGGEYFTGYVTEKALSVDNLFVFLLIMTKFKVPKEDQQKVLLVGVAIALVCRTVFILLGAALVEKFSWVFYLFGAWLIYTAVKMILEHNKESEKDYSNGLMVRAVSKFVPTTPEYHGDRIVTRVNGKRMLTPMLLVMVAIGSTDVIFALDSIPAIYSLTSEAYIVFATNAFSLLGLRQLYFLIGGLLERLVYLSQGLSVILGFLGLKQILHAMNHNDLPFINGGQGISWAPDIPTLPSLIVIVATLFVATIASLLKTHSMASIRKRGKKELGEGPKGDPS